MNKHAYLIMAHNDFYILEKLLLLLDDARNDIYLHIDKKVKNFDFNYIKSLVKNANIYFVHPIDVRWGSYRQILCELNLLSEAIKVQHKYYHFISGVDLPLKSQDQIHSFFDNSNKEFVEYDNDDMIEDAFLDRIKYYHIGVNFIRSKNKFVSKFCAFIRYRFINIQKKLGVNRLKKCNMVFQKGPNWFSITHELACFIVSKKNILSHFKYSYCADELFVQTIVANSKYKDKIYLENGTSCLRRFIDWDRGNPYVFKKDDYKALKNSNCFFARKFSSSTDKEIIDKIFNDLYEGDLK